MGTSSDNDMKLEKSNENIIGSKMKVIYEKGKYYLKSINDK